MVWQVVAIASLVATVHGRYENVNIKQDWWETAIIYHVYTRSFMDSNGDGIGDIPGITNRLDYLKELNVDAVLLSSVFKSPLRDFGYDVSDYYTIHPEYGTIEDFEILLKKAKELNIKVLMDFIPNHTSNESEWFLKSANKDEYYSDWYIWETGHMDNHGVRSPPNNWNSVFRNSAWKYHPNRDQYYFHQFGEAQPDLNYRNPVVVDEMKFYGHSLVIRIDYSAKMAKIKWAQWEFDSRPSSQYQRNIIKFWLEKGVAGMKLTSVNHLFEVDKDNYGGRYPDEPRTGRPGVKPEDYGFLSHVYTRDQEETYDMISQFRDVFDAISVRDNMTRVMITEASTGIKNSVKYYGEGMHLGAHVPINLALVNDLNKESDARDFKYTVDRWLTYKPLKNQANWMSGSHDKGRVGSRMRPQLVDAYNMLVMLLPGIAITYMGEELGMLNGFVPWSDTKDPLACYTDDPVNFVDVSRDPARTPFHWSSGKNAGFSQAEETWLPIADDFEVNNVGAERAAIRSHFQVYRTLTTLRHRPAFRLGRYESLALSHDVFAFKRWYNDDAYVVVMNVGKSYSVVNLTAFDLIFGSLEVEVSSVLSTRTTNDVVQANYLDLGTDEAMVLRMQV